MRTIDIKSLIIGVLITGLGFSLMSNSQQDHTSFLTISGHPVGIFIYNPETRQLFKYDMKMGKLQSSPKTTYLVSPDGSNMEKE